MFRNSLVFFLCAVMEVAVMAFDAVNVRPVNTINM